jgi:LmbE family N-acetylglucosaminyl deacetylase
MARARRTATAVPSRLSLKPASGKTLRILCLGAHSDDIEIGCGGTILSMLAARRVECRWIVFSGSGARRKEALSGASRFLKRAAKKEIEVLDFRDGFFPHQGAEIKTYFEGLKGSHPPDLIFTHYRADRHQDHRVISDLTWNTFRGNLILEYEIPKYDADLGSPNFYVPVTRAHGAAKIRHLMSTFATQRSRRWFSEETFRGLMRLRGIESGDTAEFAEAFYAHKAVLGL